MYDYDWTDLLDQYRNILEYYNIFVLRGLWGWGSETNWN